MGVILLRDLGEQLKAGAAVFVSVFHAHLGKHAGHGVGAYPSVGGRHCAVAATRGPRIAVFLGRAATAQ